MNNAVVIKASIVFLSFVIILGVAWGCSSVKDKNVTPQLTNGQDVYLTVDDEGTTITITNQELWDLMKLTDGINYLTQYIQEDLLATEIAAVTDEEIETARLEQIYGTHDAEIIAKIQEYPENDQDLINTFEQALIVQGLDPNDPDDLRSYFELSVAITNYTRQYILDADEDSTLYVSDEDIQERYEDTVRGDVCALVVRFNSYNEASAVFDLFNLVPDYNSDGVWGDYFGTTPIDEVLASELDSTNTAVMNDDNVFSAFIEMYNYMNPSKEQILETTTREDFCANYPDFVFNYEYLTEDIDATTEQGTLAGLLWDDLSDLSDDEIEGDVIYTVDTETIGDFETILYKVSQETVTAYEDLDQATKDAIYAELIEEKITSTNIGYAMDSLMATDELTIYDPVLKLQYFYSEGIDMDNKGDDTLVATYGNLEISAQELYEYMANTLGVYYSLEMVKQAYLLNSDYYEEIYGESRDFMNSDNETMVDHRDELRTMKASFSSNVYATYGFSSADYTWEEFLVVAFGSTTESDVILNLFVMQNLQPYAVEGMIDYTRAVDYIQEQYDQYLSIDATHLLMYLDNDFNFSPDEFNAYVEGLGVDTPEYNEFHQLQVDFEALVDSKMNNDNMSYDDIVDEYNDALVGDPENDWAAFKAYGFFLMTQDLGTLDPDTLATFDEAFAQRVEEIYAILTADYEDDDTVTEFVDNQSVLSDFGIHFITGTVNDDFVKPSAIFDNTEDGYTDYLDDFNNTSDIPTQAQIERYIELNFATTVNQSVDFTIPTSVNAAIEAYYGVIWDDYFTSTAYTIASTEYLLENNVQYTVDNAGRIAFLNDILGVLYDANFPDAYVTPLED